MKTILLAICIGAISYQHAFAQQSLNAAGGNASGSGGTVSYSIGQIDYAFKGNTTFTLAEGVQQPYEISVTALDEAGTEQLPAVYPNPVENRLFITCPENSGMTGYSLQDATGRTLHTKTGCGNFFDVDMQHYPSGNYFISIATSTTKTNHYLIIKK